MDPLRAAMVLAEHFLGREPNDTELTWAEGVIRRVLPRTDQDDPTPRVITNQGFPPPCPKPDPVCR